MPAVRPLAPRAGPALVALYVLAGSALLGIGTDVRRIVVIGQYLEGGTELDRTLQADDLVALASFVGLAATVAALVLAGRWVAGLRAGRRVLGAALGGLGGLWAWLGLAAGALVALVVTRTALSARTPQDVRDADVLDAGGQVLVLLAAAAGILVVNRLTRRHDQVAAEAGVLAPAAPRRRDRRERQERRDGGAGVPSGADADVPPSPTSAAGGEGGLRVVTEEEARGGGASGHGAP